MGEFTGISDERDKAFVVCRERCLRARRYGNFRQLAFYRTSVYRSSDSSRSGEKVGIRTGEITAAFFAFSGGHVGNAFARNQRIPTQDRLEREMRIGSVDFQIKGSHVFGTIEMNGGVIGSGTYFVMREGIGRVGAATDDCRAFGTEQYG